MRVEMVSQVAGFRVRLVAESPEETEQLRDLKSLGIEGKVAGVEFAVPRRRNSKDGQLALQGVTPAED
jgi:hypothetical protein